jgi:lipopolysaccharide export system protein LptA
MIRFRIGLLSLIFCCLTNFVWAQGSNTYELSSNTLIHLRQAGLPLEILRDLRSLVGIRFGTKEDLRAALQKLPRSPTAEALERIEQFAEMRRLQLQAQEFSGDQKKGELVFRGKVQGELPREQLHFRSALLNLVRQENYEKIRSEGSVGVEQWDQTLQAGFLFYERAEEGFANEDVRGPVQILRFNEDFRASAKQGKISGNLMQADLLRQQVLLQGRSKAEPARMELNLDAIHRQQAFNSLQELPPVSDSPETVTLQAAQATLNNQVRRLLLEGAVELFKAPEQLRIYGGRVQVEFDVTQQVQTVYAERAVCIEQPGRVARADSVRMEQATQLILLEGNAKVQTNQYDLQGESIKLYVDVSQGVAQGDDNSPIRVTILMDQPNSESSSFRCR